MSARDWCTHGLTVALNFFRQNVPESSTRLTIVQCCTTGCIIGLGDLAFAFKFPHEVGAISALGVLAGGFIGGGCVAIINRTQNTSC